jgi:hypothetical protein
MSRQQRQTNAIRTNTKQIRPILFSHNSTTKKKDD